MSCTTHRFLAESTKPILATERAPGSALRSVDTERRPLQLGILVRKDTLPRWTFDLLKTVQSLEFVSPVIISTNAACRRTKNQYGWNHLLFRIWRAVDSKLFDPFEERPWTMQSGIVSYAGIPVKNAEPGTLDMLFNLTGVPTAELPESLFDLAHLGVWSFPDQWQTDLSLFWDVFNQKHESAYTLECRTHAGTIQNQITLASLDRLSISRDEFRRLSRRKAVLRRVLSQMWHHGKESCFRESAEIGTSDKLIPPTNLQMLQCGAQAACSSAVRFLRRKLFRQQWQLAWRRLSSNTDLFDLRDFQIMRPPADRFYADPFVFENDGRSYLFFEEFVLEQNKGWISYVELGPEGSAPATVLEEKFHLSYPTLFRWQETIYMIPETRDSGQIRLYRCVDFPHRWQFEQTLIKGISAADPTLFIYRGKYWLFLSGAEHDASPEEELYLFMAESPVGPWRPHPLNPVVTDVRRARSAGAVINRNGKLFRPGQDCSTSYGAGITLSRIDILTETDYSETPVRKLSFANFHGMHTMNHSEHFQCIDLRQRRFALRARGES